MILGLGIDVIEIHRIRKAIAEHPDAFLKRLFTEKEQAFCQLHTDPVNRFAGRFAAKEAIAKAFGCGFGAELQWHDLEILPDSKGKPEVHLSQKLQTKWQNPRILLTITHSKEYALAVAIWEDLS